MRRRGGGIKDIKREVHEYGDIGIIASSILITPRPWIASHYPKVAIHGFGMRDGTRNGWSIRRYMRCMSHLGTRGAELCEPHGKKVDKGRVLVRTDHMNEGRKRQMWESSLV